MGHFYLTTARRHVPPLQMARGSIAQSDLSFTCKQGCPALLTISSRPSLVLLGAPLTPYTSLLLFFTCKESRLICDLSTCCVRARTLNTVQVLIRQAFSVLRGAQAGWSKAASGSGRPSAKKALEQRLHIVSPRLSGPAYG
jgi:hypothetical protein